MLDFRLVGPYTGRQTLLSIWRHNPTHKRIQALISMPCLPPWSAPARAEKEEVIKIRLVENVFEGSHTGGKESVD